ncbi:MAG: nucleotidyl transferase AbiEii/AbiGii toxin family protein [Sphaerochaeta sp.]|nr:nucleotidyl transferase AbiEii/AbiGii toxin family protein [Sphaerochaeta sp.]
MIDKRSYKKEHIDSIKTKYPTLDQALIERCIFALGLLEALVKVGLPFVFKGGTSLMLLLRTPYRLSTDIDIIIEPEITTIQLYLDEASQIFPFIRVEKQIRRGKNGIQKEHFKFFYKSPYSEKEIHILLDVLYENHGYAKVMGREVKNEFILTDHNPIIVQIPTIESILGDKMTAFAPHTTGIEFDYVGSNGLRYDKTLEVIKQFIPQRSESSGSMLPLPSEWRESKVRYPAPWGGKGGNASWVQGLPWGIDTFH